MGELIVIAVVALLVLGPDKLPEAAKSLSKGIRDFRKHSKELQQSLEDDEQIGGAIRDLKSAMRGEEVRPYVPPHLKERPGESADADDDDPDDLDQPFSPHERGADDDHADEADAADDDDVLSDAPEPLTSSDDDEPMVRPAAESVSRTPKVRAVPTPPSGPAADEADESHG